MRKPYFGVRDTVSTEKVLLTSACGVCEDRYESISNQEVVAETQRKRRDWLRGQGKRPGGRCPGTGRALRRRLPESPATGTNDAHASQSLLAHVGANA